MDGHYLRMRYRMRKSKNLYIHTIGCQMNIYDAEQMAIQLSSLGYRAVDSLERADLIIVNTCSVREKAEQKVYSFLGRLAVMKTENPDLLIGVSGCVAQQEGKTILRRVPQIDFVIGTRAIDRLSGIVEQVEAGVHRVVDVDMTAVIDEVDPVNDPRESGSIKAFVTIVRGCDNFCSYCVVPFVRGREVSRWPHRIVAEVQALVESGVREVTLLGQNVNSYGQKEGLGTFHELLSRINGIDGLRRIRFTTSHPKDLSDQLIRCFGSLEKLCHHIHLPVQSGSNRILKRMNRHYTREQYLEQIAQLRTHCPDIAVTSDIIVGFPGETRADFDQTLDLIKRIGYDSLYMFKYSDRPKVPAAHFSGKVAEEEKKERFQELLSIQNRVTIRKHKAQIGSTVPVLVEGLSKKQNDVPKGDQQSSSRWTGRTSTNRVVNFSLETGPSVEQDLRGSMVRVEITKAFPHSLWGNPLECPLEPRN